MEWESKFGRIVESLQITDTEARAREWCDELNFIEQRVA